MGRDAKTVAAELMELVWRCHKDPEGCRNLLAVRLEVIYDYAYANGYNNGKQFSKGFAYDLGFADGFTKAAQRLGPFTSQHSLAAVNEELRAPNTAAKDFAGQPSVSSESRSKRKLYHLPCDVCGALYTEDECPVCKARLTGN